MGVRAAKGWVRGDQYCEFVAEAVGGGAVFVRAQGNAADRWRAEKAVYMVLFETGDGDKSVFLRPEKGKGPDAPGWFREV